MTVGGHRGREERGSWRTRLRELLAAALDLLRHCTVNQFEVWRNGERMTALPVLILILLVLVAYWISLPLLVVGLFFGCKYRFSGPDLDKTGWARWSTRCPPRWGTRWARYGTNSSGNSTNPGEKGK